MKLSGPELQLFVTFMVILGCAFVALLVDYLKGKNEQLRERHVDLLVRQEQFAGQASEDARLIAENLHGVLKEQTVLLKQIAEQPSREAEALRRSGLLAPKPSAGHLKDIPVWEIPEPKREVAEKPVDEGSQVKISLIADTKLAPAPELANPVEAAAAATEREELAHSPLPPTDVPPQAEPAPAAPDFDRFLDELVNEFESNPEAYPEPVAPSAEALQEVTPPTEAISDLTPLVEALHEVEVAQDEPIEEVHSLRAGVHNPEVLALLLNSKTPLHGLAVCIGINEFDQLHKNLGKQAAEQLLGSVDALMESLLRQKTFLCRSQNDEFLLLEPELIGAAAQRRLNEVSERLWDFQLRSLGSFSVVFSWGAFESQGCTVKEAVDGARERMLETQASRKNSAFEKSRRRLATA